MLEFEESLNGKFLIRKSPKKFMELFINDLNFRAEVGARFISQKEIDKTLEKFTILLAEGQNKET
jgi:hypothetical protein